MKKQMNINTRRLNKPPDNAKNTAFYMGEDLPEEGASAGSYKSYSYNQKGFW